MPAKSQQEAQKHRQEYEKMVEIAKKKGNTTKNQNIFIYKIISKQTNLNRTQRERNEDEKLSTTDPKRGFHDQLVANLEHRDSTQLGRTVSSRVI